MKEKKKQIVVLDIEENCYELLKVDSTATPSEIHEAYQMARNAFAKDSSATYSLFSTSETKEILEKIEKAYFVLSSLEKRKAHDEKFGILENIKPERMPPTVKTPLNTTPSVTPATISETPMVSSEDAFVFDPNIPFTGHQLLLIREKRGLSVDDVSRITKIPSRYLKAMETDDIKNFPARVYLQGFIKNLCGLYRIEIQSILPAYLKYLDSIAHSPHTKAP